MHKSQTGLDNRTIKILWSFFNSNASINPFHKKKIIIVNKQISKIVNIAVLTDESLIKNFK